jgi:hypothetical protein
VRVFVLVLLIAAIAAAALPIDDRAGPEDRRPDPDASNEPRSGGAAPDDAEPRGDAPGAGSAPRGDPDPRRSDGPSAVRRARCPGDVAGCRAVSGRVLYVERVDPDGDGDLHVVVLDGSITAPGMTAVDVPPGLRPARDPRVGDLVSAAGPVQPGSYGQSQIHALEFHARRG